MASKLILDRSDPGVNELVSSWKDGETYKLEVEVKQVSTSPNTGDYDVTAVVPLESEEVEEVEEAPAKPAPKSGIIPPAE